MVREDTTLYLKLMLAVWGRVLPSIKPQIAQYGGIVRLCRAIAE